MPQLVILAIATGLFTGLVILVFRVAAPFEIRSLSEIPFIMLAGVVIGCLATAFIMLIQQFAKLSEWPFWARALLAGAITGFAAITTPEVMGIGYDTVNGAMLGELTIGTLIGVVVLKSLSNAAAVGLGLPVGLIGPTLLIGACVGGVLGILGGQFQPDAAASIAFYAMLGMAAMIAAVLQAPLAALMAVLELTMNPNVILPAMLIIVVATLVTGEVFKRKPVFLTMLTTLGLQYPPNPVTLHLQRAGVAAIMSRNVERLSFIVKRRLAESAPADNPRWIVVETAPGDLRCVLNAADLRVFLDGEGVEEANIHLLRMPGMRKDVASIDARATVEEAQQMLNSESVEALCVRRMNAPMTEAILGVITQDDIDNYREVD
ncbi:MAG: chloride channel protein [Gammaproteobacteria bacterium]|nr:chloride channel protein [Gammaproteobacteria bacterium]